MIGRLSQNLAQQWRNARHLDAWQNPRFRDNRHDRIQVEADRSISGDGGRSGARSTSIPRIQSCRLLAESRAFDDLASEQA
jgi:hypothetical protein